MTCEMEYCVYNKDFCCTLSSVRMNSLGMCDDCIIVHIPKDLLEELKEEHLADLDSGWDLFK